MRLISSGWNRKPLPCYGRCKRANDSQMLLKRQSNGRSRRWSGLPGDCITGSLIGRRWDGSALVINQKVDHRRAEADRTRLRTFPSRHCLVAALALAADPSVLGMAV